MEHFKNKVRDTVAGDWIACAIAHIDKAVELLERVPVSADEDTESLATQHARLRLARRGLDSIARQKLVHRVGEEGWHVSKWSNQLKLDINEGRRIEALREQARKAKEAEKAKPSVVKTKPATATKAPEPQAKEAVDAALSLA